MSVISRISARLKLWINSSIKNLVRCNGEAEGHNQTFMFDILSRQKRSPDFRRMVAVVVR